MICSFADLVYKNFSFSRNQIFSKVYDLWVPYSLLHKSSVWVSSLVKHDRGPSSLIKTDNISDFEKRPNFYFWTLFVYCALTFPSIPPKSILLYVCRSLNALLVCFIVATFINISHIMSSKPPWFFPNPLLYCPPVASCIFLWSYHVIEVSH